MIRERCGCGAEFETDERDPVKLLAEWRKWHKCPDLPEPERMGGTAQVETAPDYTIPDMHIGFRY